MPPDVQPKLVLLTGATGYVGGRLLTELANAGYRVRCLARRPEHLRQRLPADMEAVAGDLLNAESLRPALAGVAVAYYLVHSMGSAGDFAEQDRCAAQNFGAAAKAAGIERIIYLGGLGRDADDLSPHLRSRHEVGEVLRAAGVPIIEFRASIIIGSGSLSFEMVRALVERLPVMVTPRYARVGRKLIDSIRHPTVVRDDTARRAFAIKPVGAREAIARALRNEDRDCAQPRWSDAVSATDTGRTWGGVRLGNRLVDARSARVRVKPELAFAVIRRVGGQTGWYYANWLWTLRGWLDLVAGGVGMRRGRRVPETLRVGDTVDCWRVEAVEPGQRLLLVAEMKLPGRAWLEFEVQPAGADGAVIRQTAVFAPVGWWGLAYWYGVWPLHQMVFAGMLRGVAGAAEKQHETL